jgi:long-chain acyl-CoA synthetase
MTALAPAVQTSSARPWLASYGTGVPHTIDDQMSGTINDLFDTSVATFASHIAIESFGVSITYASLGTSASAIAAWLQASGLKQGDRVAIMSPNVAAYIPIVFGILKAGGIVVNVNPLYTAHELTHQLNDSGAKTIFVLAQFEHTVKAALKDTPLERIVRIKLGDLLGLKGHLVTFIGARKTRIPTGSEIDGAIDFSRIIATGKDRKVTPVAVAPGDIAFLQYTGGTTGVAKGAALRHSNLIANVAQCAAWFQNCDPKVRQAPGIMVTALPLYHIFALTACCLYMVKRGACSLLITNPRDIKGFITTLRTRPYTMISGVNTLYNALADHPDFKTLDFSKLELTLAGGMATQQAVADKWKKLTGKPIIEGYGLSETSPGVCFNRSDITAFTGTVGLPWPSTDVSIRNGDIEQPIGVIGELCIKGPQVMAGYWNKPEETAKAMTADGYFRSGDLAILMPDGQVKIVDRLKEMIIVSGFNVYPNEVEAVLVQHPMVREAAVVGLPDLHSGEMVAAYVVRRDDSVTSDELRAFCAQTLTKYKVPKVISFRADLPKSNVGKVLRRTLRDEVMAGQKEST